MLRIWRGHKRVNQIRTSVQITDDIRRSFDQFTFLYRLQNVANSPAHNYIRSYGKFAAGSNIAVTGVAQAPEAVTSIMELLEYTAGDRLVIFAIPLPESGR